jgi:hypothetical protein
MRSTHLHSALIAASADQSRALAVELKARCVLLHVFSFRRNPDEYRTRQAVAEPVVAFSWTMMGNGAGSSEFGID